MGFPARKQEHLTQNTVLEHIDIVHQEVRKILRRGVKQYEYNELFQIGVLGLIEAIQRYEEQKCTAFSVYARIRIQGAIIDEIRKRDWVPRSVRKRAKELNAVVTEQTKKKGRKPTDQEIASSLGLSVCKVDRFRHLSHIHKMTSLESNPENPLHESIPCEVTIDAQQQVLKKESHKHLHLVLATLNEQERRIIEMYYFEDQSLKSIAQEFGVSESRICQIHIQLKKRMAKRLKMIS